MNTKQEIKKILRERVTSIVDERILPEALDEVAHWTGELMGKLTTLDAEDNKKIDQACEQIRQGLIQEMIAQLQEPLGQRREKLFTKNKRPPEGSPLLTDTLYQRPLRRVNSKNICKH